MDPLQPDHNLPALETQSFPVLSTKLFLPRAAPDLVLRPQLTDKLDAGLKGILTLITAPAGFYPFPAGEESK